MDDPLLGRGFCWHPSHHRNYRDSFGSARAADPPMQPCRGRRVVRYDRARPALREMLPVAYHKRQGGWRATKRPVAITQKRQLSWLPTAMQSARCNSLELRFLAVRKCEILRFR